MVEHLKDERKSIPFRNHYMGSSLGNACYWNIYFQLQDRPANYSSYGYQRKGKDGKGHPKPYWQGSPFGEVGLEKWLEQNKELSYPEMQIKCLTWLLEREKKIGAPDAKSYFLNILPLEVQILERQVEAGMDVKDKLQRMKKALENKDESVIPKELLP